MGLHIDRLQQTINTLRAPGGCPWDQRQTLPDAARYLLEEAGELLDAVLFGDLANAQEELADLLFMVCFCCRILGEGTGVDLETLAAQGNEKLVRRHPHVFGDRTANTTGESQEHWDAMKAVEKQDRGEEVGPRSVLKDLPASTAPLRQASRFGEDAAAVGFDWPDLGGVWAKLEEERAELAEAAQREPVGSGAIDHEVGDLLFAVVNLARHLGVRPDDALRRANRRFRQRFRHVEERFGHDRGRLKQASLTELEAAWQEAKHLT